MEIFLIAIIILGLVLSFTLKLSFHILKFIFGLIGIILLIVLLPVGLFFIIPIVIIGIAVGILKLIF